MATNRPADEGSTHKEIASEDLELHRPLRSNPYYDKIVDHLDQVFQSRDIHRRLRENSDPIAIDCE